MTRKIIQITGFEGGGIFALAEDGTVWYASVSSPRGFNWKQLPELPDKE